MLFRSRMRTFLESNGPWDQLVSLDQIKLKLLENESPQALNDRLTVIPFQVPHRDEYSETVGYRVVGPSFSLVYIPDIDKWERWERDINEVILENDYILIDGMDLLDAGTYKGMVIGHQGSNFCAGANLANMIQKIEAGAWEEMDAQVKQVQDLLQRVRFSKAPVVAAPHHLALGGGFELVAPAAHRVALGELYIGAVEVGVGLIPGAGGNLRLILNLMENSGSGRMNSFQVAQKAFETIGFAKVATSADEEEN